MKRFLSAFLSIMVMVTMLVLPVSAENPAENSTVTGMKARVIKMDGERVDRTSDVAPSIALEHNKVPDPVAQELEMIEKELEKLRKSSEKSEKDEG